MTSKFAQALKKVTHHFNSNNAPSKKGPQKSDVDSQDALERVLDAAKQLSQHQGKKIPASKVYEIFPDFESASASNRCSLEALVNRRDELGKLIASLSKSTGEPVFFHGLEDDLMGGAISVMLECSKEFLERVKKLPPCGRIEEVRQDLDPTKRMPDLWDYFSNYKIIAAAPKAPKPGL